ncbi:MAG: hypothetical protein QF491_05740, partial [Alphaproteobacteria bacterium]|nr:hypothetical protein [Alphaproteobacteria bacterium]
KGELAEKDEVSEYENQLLDEKKRIFQSFNEVLIRDSTNLIARAVLYAEKTEAARREQLHSLGFGDGSVGRGVLTTGQLLLLFWCIVVVFVVLAIGESAVKNLMSTKQGELHLNPVFFVAVLMASIYASAVVAALLPNWFGSSTAERRKASRPWHEYFISGACAVVFWLSLSFMLRFFLNLVDFKPLAENLQLVGRDLAWSYPYVLQSVALAITIAYLTGRTRSHGTLDLRRPAYWDAILTCVVMSCASVIAFYWMEGVGGIIDGTKDAGFRGRWNPWVFVLKGGFVGLLVGALIPSWYRKNRQLTSSERIRSMFLDAQVLDRIRYECRGIDDDAAVEQAFTVATANVVYADELHDDRETRALGEFWQRFGQSIYGRFTGESFRSAYNQYAQDLQARIVARSAAADDRPAEPLAAGAVVDLDKLDPLKRRPELSKLLVLLCMCVAEADGTFSPEERGTIEEIMRRLEVDSGFVETPQWQAAAA